VAIATVLVNFSEAPPGADPNEDRIAMVRTDTGIVAWVIDGATSVDPSIRLACGRRTGEWFADELSRQLMGRASEGGEPVEWLRDALNELRNAFMHAGGQGLPIWARPLGAISLVDAAWTGNGWRIRGAHLGDCPPVSSWRTGLH